MLSIPGENNSLKTRCAMHISGLIFFYIFYGFFSISIIRGDAHEEKKDEKSFFF